jgi:hypothetical protein
MTLTALFNTYKIKYFTELELKRVSSEIPNGFYQNIIPTILIVDRMRSILGFPICINSAYRDEDKNKSVGGSVNSLHLLFNALDIRPCSYDTDFHEKLKLMREYLYGFESIRYDEQYIRAIDLGIGTYQNFIHIDTRGILGREAPKRWQG